MTGKNQCEHGQLARVCLICEQAAEIATLRQYLDAAQRRGEELRAQVAALEADAGRYKYLRDISRRDCLLLDGPEAGVWCDCEDEHGELVLLTEGDLDAAIDAALAARKGGRDDVI